MVGQEGKLQWRKPQRILTGLSSPDGHHSGIETWPYSGSCLRPDNQQDRNTAPPISRQGASSHTELTATYKHTLLTTGTRPSSTHQWAGTSATFQEVCRITMIQPRAYTRSKRSYYSPLVCKEIQPVHSKGDQSWVFFRRNDAEAETPVLWPPHVKS